MAWRIAGNVATPPAGSAIGALASLVTTWLTQHSQTQVTQRLQDRAHREVLYTEFTREASKLFGDAFEHELDDPAKFVQLYAIGAHLDDPYHRAQS